MAAKRETDMALGNVIGSNIFNILFVLGVAAVANCFYHRHDRYCDLDRISAIVWVFGWTKEAHKDRGYHHACDVCSISGIHLSE